jgi:hypothetical protein
LSCSNAPIININNNYDPRRPTTPKEPATAELMPSPESPIIAMSMIERTLFEYGVWLEENVLYGVSPGRGT